MIYIPWFLDLYGELPMYVQIGEVVLQLRQSWAVLASPQPANATDALALGTVCTYSAY